MPLTKYLESIVDYRGKTPTKTDEGTFLVTARNIKNGAIDYEASKEYVVGSEYKKIMARGKPAINDILFTTEAPLGSVALVDREDIALAQRIIKLRVKKSTLNPDFTKLSMSATYFQHHLSTLATGSTALGIKASKLHQLRLITPPVPEQTEIIIYVNEQSRMRDELARVAQKEIEQLQEYKATLIAEAVTGKIKL